MGITPCHGASCTMFQLGHVYLSLVLYIGMSFLYIHCLTFVLRVSLVLSCMPGHVCMSHLCPACLSLVLSCMPGHVCMSHLCPACLSLVLSCMPEHVCISHFCPACLSLVLSCMPEHLCMSHFCPACLPYHVMHLENNKKCSFVGCSCCMWCNLTYYDITTTIVTSLLV